MLYSVFYGNNTNRELTLLYQTPNMNKTSSKWALPSHQSPPCAITQLFPSFKVLIHETSPKYTSSQKRPLSKRSCILSYCALNVASTIGICGCYPSQWNPKPFHMRDHFCLPGTHQTMRYIISFQKLLIKKVNNQYDDMSPSFIAYKASSLHIITCDTACEVSKLDF